MDRRLSYFAGSWYPKSANQCETQISAFKKNAKLIDDKNIKYQIGVTPHAGWSFSGQLANDVIYNISMYNKPEVIILIGGHLAPADRFYFMEKCEIETPFGDFENTDEFDDLLTKNIEYCRETAEHYEPDNTTELQLPFLKYYFSTKKIIICRAPANKDALIFASNLSGLITQRGVSCALICSTDLTHYGLRFGFTPAGVGKQALEWVKTQNDKSVIDLTLKTAGAKVLESAVNNSSACCAGALAIAAETAKLLSLKTGRLVDYYTNADILNKSNPSDFVGYCGVIF